MSAVAELRRAGVLLGTGAAQVAALSGVDLAVGAGEILGVVGESGAGKSTLARTLLRLQAPAAGQVMFEGADISSISAWRLRRLRGRMGVVFEDPERVLNPRMTVRGLIEEPLRLHAKLGRAEREAAVRRVAERVRLDLAELDRLPEEIGPARLQLVALARAIVTAPKLLVLDEPATQLDIAVAADLLSLLARLRDEDGMAIVLIANDIATVRPVADRIAVLYLGEVVEQGPAAEVLRDPLHPYTQALLSAHLPADPARRGRRIRLRGDTPSPLDRTPGCSFAPRCPIAEVRCRSGAPTPNLVGGERLVACLRVLEGTSRVPLSR
jgi:oligopeptide/dipeptide ABC transporter ATP-binding protein